MDGRVDGWIQKWMDDLRWMHGCMMDGWVDEWVMDGWMMMAGGMNG